jgi:hypothetical protein
MICPSSFIPSTGNPSVVAMDEGWRMMQIFGWLFDTTQAV